MNINGKETKPRLDLGAVKLFNKASGRNMFAIKEKEWNDPEVISALIYAVAHRGNKEITMEDVDSLTMGELETAAKQVEIMMKEFIPEGKKSPLA